MAVYGTSLYGTATYSSSDDITFTPVAASVRLLFPRGPGTAPLSVLVTTAAPLIVSRLDAHMVRENYVRAGILTEA